MTLSNQTKADEQVLVRYLLGELSEAERDMVEEQYFGNPLLLEDLLGVENELIEDYIDGRLSSEARRNFEQNYLRTEEKRDRVKLVSRLRKSACDSVKQPVTTESISWWQKLPAFFSPHSPSARLAFGFASLAIVLGGVWLLYQNQRLHSRIGEREQGELALNLQKQELERQLSEEKAKSEELTHNLQRKEAERSALEEQLSEQIAANQQEGGVAPPVPSFEFGGGRASSEPFHTTAPQRRVTEMRYPSSTKFLRLKFRVNGFGYPSFVLSLRDRSENEVWSRTTLQPRKLGARKVLITLLPTADLKSGDYTLVLLGQTDAGSAEFVAEYPIRLAR